MSRDQAALVYLDHGERTRRTLARAATELAVAGAAADQARPGPCRRGGQRLGRCGNRRHFADRLARSLAGAV